MGSNGLKVKSIVLGGLENDQIGSNGPVVVLHTSNTLTLTQRQKGSKIIILNTKKILKLPKLLKSPKLLKLLKSLAPLISCGTQKEVKDIQLDFTIHTLEVL